MKQIIPLNVFPSRQLGELDVITERLKARYYSNSETSSTSQNSSSTLVPAKCGFHLPLTTNPTSQDTDRSCSTAGTATTPTPTIQRDLLEQFPESLSGKPLISNGLNVTDVLSLHNDQVRIAKELMAKANHLLETSKGFFEKPPTPPPPPRPPVSSFIIEKNTIPTSPPPTLPHFSSTKELQTVENASHMETTTHGYLR